MSSCLRSPAAISSRRPSPPQSAIAPDSGGRVVLPAVAAEIHGDTPQYEQGDGKDQIGFWANPADFVSWSFTLPRPATFTVNITYSCAAPGSEFVAEVGRKSSLASRNRPALVCLYDPMLGEVALAAGNHVLAVKPKAKPQWKAIGLKSVELKPVE